MTRVANGSSAYAGKSDRHDLRSGAFVRKAVCSSNGVTVAVKLLI